MIRHKHAIKRKFLSLLIKQSSRIEMKIEDGHALLLKNKPIA